MLIRGVVKFSARNCPGINFRKVGNYEIGTGYLQQNPTDAYSIVREAKSDILVKDWNCIIQDSRSHHSLAIVSTTDMIASSWKRIWDERSSMVFVEPDLCRVSLERSLEL